MANDFKIVKEIIIKTVIADDGNWNYETNGSMYCIKDNFDNQLSHQYIQIKYLCPDHFAVCTAINTINSENKIKTELKWGIIRVNRDKDGNIIPKQETLVIQCLYDTVTPNNLETATASYNGKLTYLDLDRTNSRYSYGLQLVPCLLEEATPFSIQYEDFAQCTINSVTGFLPREMIARKELTSNDLLTKNQMFYLSKYLNGDENIFLDENTIEKYHNLTGIWLPPLQNKITNNKRRVRSPRPIRTPKTTEEQ